MEAEQVFIWQFENAEFDQAKWELRINGKPVELEPRPVAVLFHLLRHAGQAVTKDQLMQAVYGHTHVGDGALSNAIGKLRRVLDDEEQRIIATLHKVGYRFAATVKQFEVQQTGRDAPFSLKAGARLPKRDRWKLVRPLGPGGDFEVWLAEHDKTREQRVFKVSPNGFRLSGLKRETTIFRVLKESLDDRRDLVRILDWNFDEAPFYIESEYGGLNLIEWAESQGGLGLVPLETRLRLLAETADAVARAHGAGVLHKDLKPANILISSDEHGLCHPKLTDFGSARLLEEHTLSALGITQLGFTYTQAVSADSTSGTPFYLAPEVIAGEPQTQASDVYALGVILYQLSNANLRKPLAAGWEDDIEDELLREDIAQAANGNPAKRVASAEELARRLRAHPQRREALVQRHVDEADVLEKPAARKHWFERQWVVPALCVVAAVLGTWGWSHYTRVADRLDSKLPIASYPSVAVVPLSKEGGDPSDEYRSDIFSGEVIEGLSRVRGLRVISRNASFKFKGRLEDVKAVGQAMGARDLLLIYVAKEKYNSRIQVSAGLTDVATGGKIWTQTYDRDEADLVETQQGIVSEVARALNGNSSEDQPASNGRIVRASVHEGERGGLKGPGSDKALSTLAATVDDTKVLGATASGGSPAYAAVCYITNTGTAPVYISSAKLLKEDGSERALGAFPCGGELAPGATCHVISYPLPQPGGDATICRVEAKTNGQKVIGEIELRALDGTILNSINLR